MTPKSNNSQHGMTAQQAADNVRGSYAVLWANAYMPAEIRGGSERPTSDSATFASAAEPAEDI
jgi:hypothetical protein